MKISIKKPENADLRKLSAGESKVSKKSVFDDTEESVCDYLNRTKMQLDCDSSLIAPTCDIMDAIVSALGCDEKEEDPFEECGIDSDCDPGEICDYGECVPAPAECSKDSHCNSWEVCDTGSGKCVQCNDNEDCEPFEECVNHECVKGESSCIYDEDCDEGWECEDFECCAESGTLCSTTEDCCSGLICSGPIIMSKDAKAGEKIILSTCRPPIL